MANSVCRGALEHCKALEVLAIWCANQTKLETNIPRRAELAYDVRFVMVVVEGVEKFLADWESGAQGGEDYWVRAEALVQKRRAGETDRELFSLLQQNMPSPSPTLPEYFGLSK
jgi:hypothetical protein